MSIHSINNSDGKKSNSQKLFLLHIITFLTVSVDTVENELSKLPLCCWDKSFWEMLTDTRVVLIFEILSIKNVLNLLGKFSAGVSDGNVRLLC